MIPPHGWSASRHLAGPATPAQAGGESTTASEETRGPFLAVPTAANPGEADLGVWNVFANPDIPDHQDRLYRVLCQAPPETACTPPALLDKALARFKTPGTPGVSTRSKTLCAFTGGSPGSRGPA